MLTNIRLREVVLVLVLGLVINIVFGQGMSARFRECEFIEPKQPCNVYVYTVGMPLPYANFYPFPDLEDYALNQSAPPGYPEIAGIKVPVLDGYPYKITNFSLILFSVNWLIWSSSLLVLFKIFKKFRSK